MMRRERFTNVANKRFREAQNERRIRTAGGGRKKEKQVHSEKTKGREHRYADYIPFRRPHRREVGKRDNVSKRVEGEIRSTPFFGANDANARGWKDSSSYSSNARVCSASNKRKQKNKKTKEDSKD